MYVAAASRVRPGASVFAAHPDCLIRAANNPNFAGLRLLVDEGAQPLGIQRFTPRARGLLAGASTAARELGHGFVGTEHLLLAMVREPEGIGGRVIDELAGRDRVEARLMEILGSDAYNRGAVDDTENDDASSR